MTLLPKILPFFLALLAPGLAAAEIGWKKALAQPEAWYASAEARALAASVVLHQTKHGGWPKNTDFSLPPTETQLAKLGREHGVATIDNQGTTLPLEFLARVVSAAPDPGAPEARAAFERGLDYLLRAQYDNGGWPQFFPAPDSYHRHVTYNDNAMVNVLTLLGKVAERRPPCAFVDADRRARAADAVAKGIDCILRTQVRHEGRLTAWCAQHDKRTLEPVWARNFEPPSLSGSESVGIVRFLMSRPDPSPEIVAAVEGAVAWFESVKITGLRHEDFTDEAGRPDRRVVPDPDAPALWARFYELGTQRPLFIGRDKTVHYDYAEIERERRAGYSYYGAYAGDLLAREYPVWRARHAPLLASAVVAAPPPADAIVAADGSGDYASLQEAISAAPMRTADEAPRWLIRVKPGTYRERVYVQRERGRILVRGDDAVSTIVTFDLHARLPGPDGKPLGTFATPTVQIDGDGMVWEDITIANTAGPVAQALALRADGDRLVFRRCRFLGWQDTLLLNRGRHYFEDCYVEGHVDFIFGGATAFFSRCHVHALRDGYLTAASTPEGAPHGFVFADGRVTTGPEVVKGVYLGRPWRDFARTVFLRTELSAGVRAEGWHNWKKPAAEKTAFYAEHGNTGPGAASAARVSWARILSGAEAAALTPRTVLSRPDGWDPLAR